jgi:prolyl 4-hydroxylase
MRFDELPEPLRQWVDQCLAAGTTDDGMVSALNSAGYASDQAEGVLQAARERRQELTANPPPAIGPSPAAAAPSEPNASMASSQTVSYVRNDPWVSTGQAGGSTVAQGTPSSELLAQLPNALESSDRRVSLLFALNSPRVILFGDLLDQSECDALVAASRSRLERSTVLNPATGQRDVEMARTSSGTYFRRGENPLIETIERRIAELTGHPVEHGEPLQILHYLPGAEYKPHFDWFDPGQPGNRAVLAMGGQRVATVVMYLNEVESGGSTVFPHAGLDVLPRKGNAVFFAYKNPGEDPDPKSLHGGTPVAAGEKWIATKWIRERPYPSS